MILASERHGARGAVTLRPDRRFSGGERSLIRFRIPGGTVADTRLTVTHSPVFAVGEAVLLFLAGDSGRLPRAVAGEAGKGHPLISTVFAFGLQRRRVAGGGK